MSELLSVALVCAGTLLAQDCSRDTALDVIIAPAHTPMECLMHAQTMAAQAGLPGAATGISRSPASIAGPKANPARSSGARPDAARRVGGVRAVAPGRDLVWCIKATSRFFLFASAVRTVAASGNGTHPARPR